GRGFAVVAREHGPETGADFGGRVEPGDRLVETEFPAGIGARDEYKFAVDPVAFAARPPDLVDELGQRYRMRNVFVVMRALREQLILDVDPGNSGGGELAHRAHRVQRLAEPRAGLGD